jgi:hemerythrin-like domain-containing protein
MADTTKRTIKENVSINNQLQRMSDKVIKMIEENDNVKIKEKVQKRHIDLLEENEKEFARKNVSNLKIIRMLTEKCRNQEAIINDLEERYNELKESESNQEQIIQNNEIQM